MTGSRDSDASRVLFVHIMKTAGTTFMLHLRTVFAPEEIYPGKGLDWNDPDDVGSYVDLARLAALPAARLDRVRLVAGHYPYSARHLLPGDVQTVTILREPVARTVSLLKHFKRLHPPSHDRTLRQIYEDPDRFVGFIENHQTRVFAIEPADRVRTFREPIALDERRFATALANLHATDVLGITERFDDFLEGLRTRLGWWPDGVPPVPRANVAEESWAIDDGLIERIAADNRWDVALYEEAVRIVEAGA